MALFFNLNFIHVHFKLCSFKRNMLFRMHRGSCVIIGDISKEGLYPGEDSSDYTSLYIMYDCQSVVTEID